MDIDAIKKFMDLIKERGIKKIRIKDEKEGFEIEVDTQGEEPRPYYHPPVHHQEQSHPPAAKAPEHHHKEEKGNFVLSPMVGTFYMQPSPKDPPFIQEGDQVDEESVIGIVEAMKVMNEVKAGMKGKVSQILVSNGEAIEYGTKLVKIV